MTTESANISEQSRSVRKNPKRVAEMEMWRNDLRVLIRILQDKETPRYAIVLMIGVLAWGLIPIDPLPDIIPLVGIIDDATVFLIVRAGVYRSIPDEVIEYHTEIVREKSKFRFDHKRAVGSLMIVQVIVVLLIVGTVTTSIF